MDTAPTLAEKGTLYFMSTRPGGQGQADLYRSVWKDGRFGSPENLGSPVNTADYESSPFIAPDESYLLFASDKPGGYGLSDLYVSFRNPDGAWGEPVNLGPTINEKGTVTRRPSVSPDGRFLFFLSGKTGRGDVYWVNSKVIHRLKGRQP